MIIRNVRSDDHGGSGAVRRPWRPAIMIKLGKPPPIDGMKRSALAHELRRIIGDARLASLRELGDLMRPRRSPQRISEVICGQRLPDANELRSIGRCCEL